MTTPTANAIEKSTTPLPAEPPRRNWRIDWIVLAACLTLTIAATLHMKQSVDRAKEEEFSSHCTEAQHQIVGRLYDHARILRSGAAYFNASDTVTREEWRIYNHLQKLEQQLPGIQGIGFSLLIPRKELTGHIQKIRSEGFPEYKITPEGDRESYTSIIYLEPFDWRNQRAFGYDMFSEPVRREAMERARDIDIASLSGKVLLVQETGEDVQAGNLIYVPVYRKNMPIETIEQRRAAIYGWVYSPYRMNDLMNGILHVRDLPKEEGIYLQVFDGNSPSPQNLLYESPLPVNLEAWTDVHFIRQIPVEFNGHTWTLLFRQTSNGLTKAAYMGVWIALFAGIIITLLLFALTRNLLRSRANALRLVAERTGDLQAERQRLAQRTSTLTILNQELIREVKERGVAEAALYKSEAALRQLLAAVMDAQDQERAWVADELTEGIGQSIAAANFVVGAIIEKIDVKADLAITDDLETILRFIETALKDLQGLGDDLHPDILDSFGILETISWFCQKFQEDNSGVRVNHQSDLREDEIPQRLKIPIYRIIQEAFSNVAGHSGANSVEVHLGRTENGIKLTVSDNGCGIGQDMRTSSPHKAPQMRISSMQERAKQSGGLFTIESSPGKGTPVCVTWVLKKAELTIVNQRSNADWTNPT